MNISFPRGKLRNTELNARLDNTADSLPWPQPTEIQHQGVHAMCPPCHGDCNQGRQCDAEWPPMDRKTLLIAIGAVALCLIPCFIWPQGLAVF